MHLRCVIWEDPGRTVRNLISALLMCHGSQLDQSLTTLWLRPNRLLTAVLWHWMICRLQIAYSLLHQTSCWQWNHTSFSRLLVPFTVNTSITRKHGSAFNVLHMNFGWGGRLSSCSCCRVGRNRSNRWQIWKMVTLSSWRANPLHETIGSWPVSVKPIQVTMTYFERLKSQS